MKKNTIDLRVRLTEENHNILSKLNKKSNIPMNRIINLIISDIDKKNINLLDYEGDLIDSEVRFKITPNERSFLEQQALKSGAGNLTTEIKYRLLNSIYKNKFFTNYEMLDIAKARTEINKIGVNLNQLLRQIYKNENLIDYNNEIKELMNELKPKIEQLNDQLGLMIQYTNNRF